MQKSFLFDLNRCTGCQACTVACAIENYEKQDINWREVHTFNEVHHPELSFYNLSLACNHCAEPACLPACPAKAYTKDETTGAVLINSENCIGCKYCTWACPYDAPKFNEKKKVIEKCTFCNDRLIVGNNPACVTACPTGALSLTDWNHEETIQNIPGFTNSDLQPAIKFIPLRNESQKPEFAEPIYSRTVLDFIGVERITPESKISLKSEFPLMIFTNIIVLLVSWFTSHIVGNVKIIPLLFFGAGLVAMGLSTSHLGNKLKAYRAILNFKTSWLSREIVFISFFIGSSALFLFIPNVLAVFGWITISAGFLSLFSIDMLYRVAKSKIPLHLHSASTFLTAIFLIGIFTFSQTIIIIFGFTKLALYVYRKNYFFKIGYNILPLIIFFRILIGFILPALILFMNNADGLSFTIIIISVILGELIDRCEFYDELDVWTPEKQIAADMNFELQNETVS